MGSTLSTNEKPGNKPIPFGKAMVSQFPFDPSWKNLNHGSFGSYPLPIRARLRALQDECEARPDLFIRYTYPRLLDASRASLAKLLNAPVSTIVFVPNATTGVNTVLKNLEWNPNGKDDILSFSTIYGACYKTILHLAETNPLVTSRAIKLTLPLSDAAILDLFHATIAASRAAGHTPKLALFDTVASMPGYRMPFEALIAVCKEEGILSLVDGAHGIGHVALSLSTLDPDFFVSNCHKWLLVPRGCAVFYVPERNQHLIRTTLPTSHGFVPKEGTALLENPLPKVGSGKSAFETNFQFVGTIDNAPYLCVPDAVKWREEVCGGEEKIRAYCTKIVKEGAKKVAEILGTEILDNEEGTMTDCCLVNVRLPLEIGERKDGATNMVEPGFGPEAKEWILRTLIKDHQTFIAICFFQNAWWARLSGQVYLELKDFETAGLALKSVCERVGKGEYLPERS